MKNNLGFVYLWKDMKCNKFYIGSHIGKEDDGYICSNKRMKCKYKSRPETFRRKILSKFENITSKELLKEEEKWLSLIKDTELTVKYYNEKKVASGGDIISSLPEERRKQHSIKSGEASRKYWENITKEELNKRKLNAFGGNKFDRTYLKDRNKKLCSKNAEVKCPNGEIVIINNVAEFCRNQDINYQNFKTVLRGNGKHKTCSGYSGKYI